jgi:hypothetical protein
VQTGKAVGAVVAVVGSRSLRGAYPAAYLAGKGLIAGFVSVVLVIFRIMLHISSKRLSFGRRMTYADILITNKTIDKKSSHNPYTQDYARFFV